MPFDNQAREEGYLPCARGEKFCELEVVRPGKVQSDETEVSISSSVKCPCDDPDSLAAELKDMAEEVAEAKREARKDFDVIG